MNLEEIKKLRKNAIDGLNWCVFGNDAEPNMTPTNWVVWRGEWEKAIVARGMMEIEAEFIAAAPEMIDFLLSHIKDLDETIEVLEQLARMDR